MRSGWYILPKSRVFEYVDHLSQLFELDYLQICKMCSFDDIVICSIDDYHDEVDKISFYIEFSEVEVGLDGTNRLLI